MTTARDVNRTRRPAWVPLTARLAVVLAMLIGSVLATGGALPRSAGAQAGDAPETAALVPEDAVLYFALDLDFESAQWRQTEELLARAGFPGALDQLRRSIVADIETATPEAEATLDAFLGGELGIVVTETAIAKLAEAMAESGATGLPLATPTGEVEGVGVAAILTTSDPDAAWATIEDEQAQEAADTGVDVEETDYRGTTILFTPDDERSDTGLSIARLDDAILLAGSPADLEPIIDTAEGDAASLADADELANVRAELAAEALLFGYVNGESLADALGPEFFEAMRSMMPQAAGMGTEAWTYSSGFVLWADAPGFRMDTIALVPAGEEPPFLPENADITWDERVSAETLFFVGGTAPPGMFSGLALSLAEAINAGFGHAQATPVAIATDFAERLSPEYAEEQLAAAERILGFDLQAELFDQFGGEYVVAGSFSGLLLGALGVSAVVATEVEDPATVADSMQQVARLIETSPDAPDVTTRQVNGDTVHVVRDPDQTDIPAIEFGVVGNELVTGVGTGLDDFVNGPADSLANDEQYQRVLATLPDEYYQVTYVDLEQIVSVVTMFMGSMMGTDVEDADPACADFSTQAAAQETYDADPFANSDLDQDFDGEACEDFFDAAPAATPLTTGSYEAIEALAAVAYRGEGVIGSSTILYIAEP